MTDDTLLKKLEDLIDSKLDTRFTPVKELAEVIDHKIRKIEAMESMTTGQIQMIKDQQSVMNRKLDEHSAYFDNQVLPALITIEDKIDKYSDMYKINGDNILRHEKRLAVIEDKLSINTDPDLKHVEFRNQT